MIILLALIGAAISLPVAVNYAQHPANNILTQSKKDLKQTVESSINEIQEIAFQSMGGSVVQELLTTSFMKALLTFLRLFLSFLSKD